ncbi:MAG TPA: hypothetical protein PLT26_14245 [Anaerolineaceae bacterium]|nr:hypothetical protein [Anaerolineaceae bacterium]
MIKKFSPQILLNVFTILVVAAIVFVGQAYASTNREIKPLVRTQEIIDGSIADISTIPGTISYQGMLISATGEPINGIRTMIFRIYDAPTAGNLLWQESQAVSISNEQFNVNLGSIVPFTNDIWQNDSLYLGIQVEDDSEMSPRQMISSVPQSLGVSPNSVNTTQLAPNSVTTEKLALNSVTTEKLALSSVTTEKLALSSVTTEKLALNSVTASQLAQNAVTSQNTKLTNGRVGALMSGVGSLTLSTTPQTVPNTTVNITVNTPQVYFIFVTIDIETTSTGIGGLYINDVSQIEELGEAHLLVYGGHSRGTVSQVYRVLLDPGVYNLEIKAYGSGFVWQTHTSLTYFAVSQ